MTPRVIRWLLVALVAWGFRRGITGDRMQARVDQCFGHRPPEWREDVILDARARNRRKILARMGISA
jgi:hypothetical protein